MNNVIRSLSGAAFALCKKCVAPAVLLMSATSAYAGSVQLPVTITEYVPFEVTVTTDSPRCVGFPVVGDMQYRDATLVTALTHLGAPGEYAGCPSRQATTRRVNIPGLPRGQQTLRFDVTATSLRPDSTGSELWRRSRPP